MPKRRRHRKSKSAPASTSRAAAWIGPGLLTGLALLLAMWIYAAHNALRDATEAISSLGGTVRPIEEAHGSLGVVSFRSKPITDDDLAFLRPYFIAATGPADLDLSETKVTDAGIEQLAPLIWMDVLRLNGTAITGKSLGAISKLGSLSTSPYHRSTELYLQRTKVDDDDLARLANILPLDELDLSETLVTGPGLGHLHRLKNLHKVILNGCPISDDGLRYLRGWTTLYTLGLSNTRITDQGLGDIRSLEQLQSLSLKGTRITDAGLVSLHGWKSLTALSLADTAISDEGVIGLMAGNSLVSLDVDGTAITDDGLRRLSGWPTLQSLSLERTSISDAGLLHLADLPKLQRILLRESRFTKDGLAELKRRKPKLLADY